MYVFRHPIFISHVPTPPMSLPPPCPYPPHVPPPPMSLLPPCPSAPHVLAPGGRSSSCVYCARDLAVKTSVSPAFRVPLQPVLQQPAPHRAERYPMKCRFKLHQFFTKPDPLTAKPMYRNKTFIRPFSFPYQIRVVALSHRTAHYNPREAPPPGRVEEAGGRGKGPTASRLSPCFFRPS